MAAITTGRYSGLQPAITELIAPALVGQDPRDINLLMGRINRVITGNPFTKSAVEMALWDLAGKAAGLPLYQLLGGKVRVSVPMKMVVGAFPVKDALKLADYCYPVPVLLLLQRFLKV